LFWLLAATSVLGFADADAARAGRSAGAVESCVCGYICYPVHTINLTPSAAYTTAIATGSAAPGVVPADPSAPALGCLYPSGP
jgi:hypothetical protein